MSAACPNATPPNVPESLTGGAGANDRSPQRVPRARASLTSPSARVASTGACELEGTTYAEASTIQVSERWVYTPISCRPRSMTVRQLDRLRSWTTDESEIGRAHV